MSAVNITIQELVALKPYFNEVFSEQTSSDNLTADPEILQHVNLNKSLPKNFLSATGEQTSFLQYLASKFIKLASKNAPEVNINFENPEEMSPEPVLFAALLAGGSFGIAFGQLREVIERPSPSAVLRLMSFSFLYGFMRALPKTKALHDLIQDSAKAYEDPSRSDANINADLRKLIKAAPFRWSIYRNLLLSNQQLRNLHVLIAMTATHLTQRSLYEDLEQALGATSDPALKTILLLKQIKYLSSKKVNSQDQNRDDDNFDDNSKEKLLQQKFKQLRSVDGKLLEDFRINLANHYLNIFKNKGDLSKTLTSIHILANQENLFLLRNLRPNSVMQEIFFNYVRHLCLTIENHNLIEANTSNEEIKSLNANKMRLLIDCLQTTVSLACTVSEKTGLITLIQNDCSKKIKELLDDANFSINYLTKEYKQELIKLGFVTDDRATLSLQQVLELLPELEAYGLKSLDDILSRIINGDDNFTKLTFKDNSNWWHHLARMDFGPKASSLIVAAMQRLRSLNVSPYNRDAKHNTAFAYIPKDDPNQVKSFLIPKDVNDLIGMEKTIGTVSNFFKTVIRNPSTTNHCLLLHGPPGVGKTEVIKRLTKHHGYRMVMFNHGESGDRYVGGIEARIKALFRDANASGTPTCIFIDEADSSTLERGDGVPSGWDPATTGNAIQQAIDKFCPNSKVVVVFATNYVNKIKQAIKSRAGLSIEMRLPDIKTRKMILEHLLRNDKIANHDILQSLAMRMVGWAPRQIEKYVDIVLSSIAEHCDIIDDHVFHEHFAAGARDALAQLNLRGVEIEVSTVHNNPNRVEEAPPIDEAIVKQCDEIKDFLNDYSKYEKLNIKTKRTLFYADSPEYNMANSNCLTHAKKLLSQTNCVYISISDRCDVDNLIDFIKQCEKVVLFIPNLGSAGQSIAERLSQENFPKTILAVVATTEHQLAHNRNTLFQAAKLSLPNVQRRKELFAFYFNKRNLRVLSDKIQNLAEASDGWSEEHIKFIITNTIERLAYSAGPDQDEFAALVAQDIISTHAPKTKKPNSGFFSYVNAILNKLDKIIYAILILDNMRNLFRRFMPGFGLRTSGFGDVAPNNLAQSNNTPATYSTADNVVSYAVGASMIFSTCRIAASLSGITQESFDNAQESFDKAKKSVASNVEYYRNKLGL